MTNKMLSNRLNNACGNEDGDTQMSFKFEWFETAVHCQSSDKLRVQGDEEAREIP